MAALPMNVDYYYQKGLRTIANTPPEIKATPSAEGLTLAYVAGKSMEDQRAKEFSENVELGEERLSLSEQRLADIAQRSEDRLAFKRDILGTAAKQNRWATGISLANVGLTGLGGYVQIKEAEKQEKINDLFIKHATEMGNLKKKMYQDVIDILKQKKEILNR